MIFNDIIIRDNLNLPFFRKVQGYRGTTFSGNMKLSSLFLSGLIIILLEIRYTEYCTVTEKFFIIQNLLNLDVYIDSEKFTQSVRLLNIYPCLQITPESKLQIKFDWTHITHVIKAIRRTIFIKDIKHCECNYSVKCGIERKEL